MWWYIILIVVVLVVIVAVYGIYENRDMKLTPEEEAKKKEIEDFSKIYTRGSKWIYKGK